MSVFPPTLLLSVGVQGCAWVSVCPPVPEPIYYRQESEQSKNQVRKQENVYVKNFWLNKSFPLLFASQNNRQQDREKERDRERENARKSLPTHRDIWQTKRAKPRKGKSFRSSTMRVARIETETGTESVLAKLQKPNQKLVNFCISINFSRSFCLFPSYHIPLPFLPCLYAVSLIPFATRIIDVDLRCFCEAATLAASTLNPTPSTPLGNLIACPYAIPSLQMML